ncbi:unnamed protein product [Larinioides sclopetarius]|uniref:Uncharacterized protein n=1 Tax=Larinioides sclopetarius TaxID=280406 RepID=A0AAV1YY97_9ARAC
MNSGHPGQNFQGGFRTFANVLGIPAINGQDILVAVWLFPKCRANPRTGIQYQLERPKLIGSVLQTTSLSLPVLPRLPQPSARPDQCRIHSINSSRITARQG